MHYKLLFLDNLGGGELLIIIIFVLMFFGSEKIPGLMRSLGRAMREFRTAMDDVKSDLEKNINEPVRQLKENMEISINEPVNSVTRTINKAITTEDTTDNGDIETNHEPQDIKISADNKNDQKS